MSAKRTTNLQDHVLAARARRRDEEIAAGGRPRATRIPSGKAYSRKAKHAAKAWS